MSRLNFPDVRSTLGGNIYPTLMGRPDWDTMSVPPLPPFGARFMPRPLARPAKVARVSVAVVGPYSEGRLLPSSTFPEAPVAINPSTLYAYTSAMAPLTEPDFAEWMYHAAAYEITSEQMEREYRRAGSQVVATSGDAYSPGVHLQDMSFVSTPGRNVANTGSATARTPRGNLTVPAPGKVTGVFSDILMWAAVPNAWLSQWTGILIRWNKLATNPQDSIRFPSYLGLVAPQFIAHEADFQVPVNFVKVVVSSDKDQEIKLTFREPSDYTQAITSLSLKLLQGQNEARFELFAFPYVPAMAVQIEAQDQTQTILDRYTVSAIPFLD